MTGPAEWVDVVDEEDRVVGRVSREEMRRRKLRHRAVYVFVFRPEGTVFVHRRTSTKDIYPGCYDVAVGGVVSSGESYDEAARRELAEELGVSGAELEPLFPFRYSDELGAVNGMVYRCAWAGPVRLQEAEIEWGGWLRPEEVEALARRARFCPDSLHAWLEFRARAKGS
ncbi:MAG: putative Nudix hydrolase [Candidatus Binatia bacterium]|nr:MAG: putative Nudix hydrolase [Candidatus Binatia bacterium]